MKTEIEIEEIAGDEYLIVGDGSVYGSFPSLEEAVKWICLWRPDYVRANHMKIRHRFTAYIDKTVDCTELLDAENKKN